MINYIIQTNRISLISHLSEYFKNFGNIDTLVLKLNKSTAIWEIGDKIASNTIRYFIFSNGTDKIDREIYQVIKEINPAQKCIFSENAWLTWQDFLYLDNFGIGCNSDIYGMTYGNLPSVKIPKALKNFIYAKCDERLSSGTTCPYYEYIMVPLQVNNDSKLIIGSPYFKKVEDFVDYIVKMVPSNIKILFKNHPANKNRIAIPNLPNVIDISDSNFSKKSLIENSLFVAGINSTLLIESIFLQKKTVSYGLDIFSNKNITIDGFGKTFSEIHESNIDVSNIDSFIDLLISRQIPKKHIVDQYRETILNENFFTPRCSS